MGLALVDGSPLFRSVLHECDDNLKGLPNGPKWSIVEELSKLKGESNITEAEYAQPLCTAIQIAIICLLRSWGIRPGAVVGHSSGEIAAAFAAGMLSLRAAIVTAYYRGLLFANDSASPSNMSSHGSMCAIGMSEDDCRDLMHKSKGQVQVAAVNSPQSCTLSGEGPAIHDIVETCSKEGQSCRLLKVDRGDHTCSYTYNYVANQIRSIPFKPDAAFGASLPAFSSRSWHRTFTGYTNLPNAFFCDWSRCGSAGPHSSLLGSKLDFYGTICFSYRGGYSHGVQSHRHIRGRSAWSSSKSYKTNTRQNGQT